MAAIPRMLTRVEVQVRLGPVRDPIVDSYLAAWQEWLDLRQARPGSVAPLEAVDRKAFVHRHVVYQLGTRLPDGYQITDSPGFNCLPVGANLLCRFKSLEGEAPIAYPTTQQQGIERQQLSLLVLNGLAEHGITEPPTIVTVGYTTSVDMTQISRVVVDWRCRSHQPWEFNLYPDTIEIVEPLAFPGIDPVRPAAIESSLPDEEDAHEDDEVEEGDGTEGA